MTAKRLKYEFQFNGDVDSCMALASMFRDGWTLERTGVAGGFKWFYLEKWI